MLDKSRHKIQAADGCRLWKFIKFVQEAVATESEF